MLWLAACEHEEVITPVLLGYFSRAQPESLSMVQVVYIILKITSGNSKLEMDVVSRDPDRRGSSKKRELSLTENK